MSAVALDPDLFLSRVMDQAVYRVPVHAADSDRDDLLRAAGPGSFLYAKVPATQPGVLRQMQTLGFYVVDAAVTLAGVPRCSDRDWVDEDVRVAAPEDRGAVADLGGSCFRSSRFHLDPQIDRQVADRIKRAWVDNFFVGDRGDSLIVATMDDRVVGFLQLFYRDNDLIIDLIGVAEEGRRRGLARRMSEHAWRHCGAFDRVVVGTQANNGPALALYQSMGCRVVDITYVLHAHVAEDA